MKDPPHSSQESLHVKLIIEREEKSFGDSNLEIHKRCDIPHILKKLQIVLNEGLLQREINPYKKRSKP